MTRRSLLTTLALSLGILQAAEKVVGGPVVVNVRGKRATIAWMVQTSDVKVGKAPGNLDISGPVLRVEKVTLTNLEAGTTYHYDVLGGQPEGQGRFKTPPARKAAHDASYQFAVFGDSWAQTDAHRRLVGLVIKAAPDFVLHTGDFVYDGNVSAFWPVFFSIEKELLNKVAFYPVIGNHDGTSRLYHDVFDQSESIPYYSFDWGSAHFAMLNSVVGPGNGYDAHTMSEAVTAAFWNEQLQWLEADLAAAQKADLRFVVMHNPIITSVSGRSKTPSDGLANHFGEKGPRMISMFEKYKVQALITGHDQNYQHHVKNGVQYIVTGGCGWKQLPLDPPIPNVTRKAESVDNFLTVKVAGGKAVVEAVRLDGSLIERFQVP